MNVSNANNRVKVEMKEKCKKRRAPAALCRDCGVCSAPAPDHLHFGGHCCYSCRAFFRRTIERMERMDIVCKTGDNLCEVTENTKSCSSCRYQKCLEIGMKRELLQGKRKSSSLEPTVVKKNKPAKKRKTGNIKKQPRETFVDGSTTSKCVTKYQTRGQPSDICTKPDYGAGNCVKTSVIQPRATLKSEWMLFAPAPTESPIKTEPIHTTLNEMYHNYVGNQDPRTNEVSVIVSDKTFSDFPTAPKIQNQAMKEAHNLLDTNAFNRILEDLYKGGSRQPARNSVILGQGDF